MRDTRNAHEDELQSLSFDERWDRWGPRDAQLCFSICVHTAC